MKIVIASNAGIYKDGIDFDCYLYDLLERRGHEPILTLCDGVMSACQMSKFPRVDPLTLATKGQIGLCKKCISTGRARIGTRKHILLSDFQGAADAQQLLGAKILGDHARAGAIRYFASTNLDAQPHAEVIYAKYYESANTITRIYENIFTQVKPERVIAHHGIYVPQGVVVELARKKNIPTITWVKTYRKDTYLFSWNESYHFTMQKISSDWSKFSFSKYEISMAQQYLESRRLGTLDSIHFNKNPSSVKLDKKSGRARFLLLTSVFWDAQLHYDGLLFGSQVDWLRETILFFKKNKDLELVVRVHPAEIRGAIPSREPAREVIKEALGKEYSYADGESNILLVDADDPTSTYDLIDQVDCVIVYNTKTAIEAAACGVPVVVAGDSWIKKTGFDITPLNEEEYFQILKECKFSLSKEKQKLALKYFYYFYFKRMFEFDIVGDGFFDPKRSNYNKFNDSESVFLECLEDGSRDFIYPAEGFMNKIFARNDYLRNTLTSPYRSIAVLRHADEIGVAQAILKELNIDLHHDHTKDWDVFGFLCHALSTFAEDDVILDAGCGSKAVLASRLVSLGFENVHGIDLKEKLASSVSSKVVYRSGNLTSTAYESAQFDAVMMMSVIEHCGGYVDILREMARILKPGGQLIISTDYWYTKIDCSGIFPYGVDAPEMMIFSAAEIEALIESAASFGFCIDYSSTDLMVMDRVCRWERTNREYTFIRLIFRKVL